MKIKSTHEGHFTGEQLAQMIKNKAGYTGREYCKIVLVFDDGDSHREVSIEELTLVRVSWTTDQTLRGA